ncbi:hypothetical protein AJ87_21505 [Rhizobium yanglingense]|nr:hypothetical protein AJ87_21505 [Rhizobium yanglingense]
MSIFESFESTVRTDSRSFPATFHKAAGYRLYDTSVRSWIDSLSGAGALNYGQDPQELVKAVVRYLRDDGVITSLDLQTSAKEQFLESMIETVQGEGGINFASTPWVSCDRHRALPIIDGILAVFGRTERFSALNQARPCGTLFVSLSQSGTSTCRLHYCCIVAMFGHQGSTTEQFAATI